MLKNVPRAQEEEISEEDVKNEMIVKEIMSDEVSDVVDNVAYISEHIKDEEFTK